MLISIIIPAFNEGKYIIETLTRVKEALSGIDREDYGFEIIVCDNNSTDNTAQLAKSMGAKVVFEPVNQISRARNKGASEAKGEWLLFLDADSYPTLGLMLDVLELIKEGEHIGCGSTIKIVGGTLFNMLRMERLNPIFRLLNVSGGVFLVCQKEGFDAINGFSKDLFALEEFDFIRRLKKYGKQKGKKFTVLFDHPVITSGRKGDFKLSSILILFLSQFAAIFLFLFYYLLPRRVFRKINSKFLQYWYSGRN